MQNAARAAGTRLAASLVHYLDLQKHHGHVSAFNKAAAYAWQSEYRIVIEPTGHPVAHLDLGSLEDISVIAPSSELNNYLEFQLR